MIPKGTKPGRIKPKASKDSAIRRSARGQQCTLRLDCCNGNTETTILAHIRHAAWCGAGMKPPDILGLYACSACHDMMDGRSKGGCTYEDILRAHNETLLKMVELGLIVVK